jgi:hypothetical protein
MTQPTRLLSAAIMFDGSKPLVRFSERATIGLAMRLYRSIVTGSLLTAAVAFANTATADRIHDYAESLNYTGISNLLQEDPWIHHLPNYRSP